MTKVAKGLSSWPLSCRFKLAMAACYITLKHNITIIKEGKIYEGLPAKRAYIAFLADFFIFGRIKLIFGRLTCVDMKNIVP